jgi:GxxExxY protein
MMELVESELTASIKGCFYDVQNQVGLGLPEEAYQQGLIAAFATRGIPALSKEEVWLEYLGRRVVKFLPDFQIAGKVVLELKSLREGFAREHYIQLFSYLKATRFRLGFLVNFGRERVDDQRILFDEKPLIVDEHWDAVKGQIHGNDREIMTQLRQSVLDIGCQFGLGYSEETYRKLVIVAVEDRGLSLNREPEVEPHYREQSVGRFPVDCLLVASRIVCVITALKDGLDIFDLARTQSYLSNLHLRFGIAVNFGKNQLDVKGVRIS